MYKFELKIKDNKDITDIKDDYADRIIKRLNISKDKIIEIKALLLIDANKLNVVSHNAYLNNFYLKKIFTKNKYKSLQPYIASFFMENFKFRICPYCGIDFINSYKDNLVYYEDFDDFILNAPEGDLKRLKQVGNATIQKIFNCRNGNNFKQNLGSLLFCKIKKSYDNYISNPEFYNHFTLDHSLPKEKYPFFQLSLYNLIPACYSCNCKLKGSIELDINVIPNSVNYDLDKLLEFRLLYNLNQEVELSFNTRSLNDSHINYLKEFKILGRYNEHLGMIKDLEEKALKYNATNIKQISQLLNIRENEVKKHIFGKELLNGDKDSHLFKFKSDILKVYNV